MSHDGRFNNLNLGDAAMFDMAFVADTDDGALGNDNAATRLHLNFTQLMLVLANPNLYETTVLALR